MSVTNDATLSSNLTVTGNSTFNGNIDLGNATSDTITPVGRFDASILPASNGAYNLGAGGLEFLDLHLTGTAHIDTLDVDANAGIIGNLTVTGNSEFNGTVDVDAAFAVRNGTTDKFTVANTTGNIFTTGALTVTGATDLKSTLNVDSNTTLGGTLSVTNNATLSSNLTVNGNTTLGNTSGDTVTIPGILDNNGRAQLGNILIEVNTISAQNSDGSVNIVGNGSGHINLNDDVDIAGTLDVAGVFNANSSSNFSGDATFNGGAAAVNISANSDIRLVNGTWTGDSCKHCGITLTDETHSNRSKLNDSADPNRRAWRICKDCLSSHKKQVNYRTYYCQCARWLTTQIGCSEIPLRLPD